jgi:predicted DNA-binding protein with PD1-like motif
VTVNWTTALLAAIRLKPGDDLKSELKKFATVNDIEAAVMVTAVGSLSDV